MKYMYILLLTLGMNIAANASQISKEECEEVWAKGEIIHDFDELEVVGGNYRPRSYIRYNGLIYYGMLTIEASKGKVSNIQVTMSCWDSKTQ
jgi:hypothetical protein